MSRKERQLARTDAGILRLELPQSLQHHLCRLVPDDGGKRGQARHEELAVEEGPRLHMRRQYAGVRFGAWEGDMSYREGEGDSTAGQATNTTTSTGCTEGAEASNALVTARMCEDAARTMG